MHGSVSLMHCCGGRRVSCGTLALAPLLSGPPAAAAAALLVFCSQSQRYKENTRHHRRSSCWQRGVAIQGQTAAFMYVGHLAASPFGTGRNVWKQRRINEQREGGREGRFPALGLHLAAYLESLLMTRISAPFSSLRRWLSALRSTRTWMKTKSHFTSPTKSNAI